jgi:predicted HicB family RNase H-like nuclease
MGMANDMQKLADEIMASYKVRADELQQRLKDNDMMVKDVQEMLQGFRNDHQEIVVSIKANAEALKENAKKLKADMAKDEQDRLNAFKEMMDGIKGTISKIQDEVVSIKISTENMLKDFSTAHSEMTAEMQEEFTADKNKRAEWNAGRMNSFNEMMQDIHDDMDRIRKEVAGIFDDVAKFLVETNNMMKTFATEHSDMSAELRASLQANLKERQDQTRSLLNDFNKRLAEISNENQDMAKKLHAELNKSRKDLADSDVQRLKDFKVTMGAIQGRVNEIQGFVSSLLGDLKNERIQASEIWDKLAEAKAHIGKIIQPAPAAKKEAPKAEKPVEPAVNKPVAEKKPVEPAKTKTVAGEKPKQPVAEKVEKKELSLEDRVLDYIAKHPKGIRVSDMEKPLGETRMKIGYTAKQLLDEGKVNKVDNLYFPKP